VRRGRIVAGVALVAALAAGCGDDDADGGSGPPAEIAAGTYGGNPECTGADRFSNGDATEELESAPDVSATFGEGGELTGWTYIFLGDEKNEIVETDAVAEGDTFGYDAGAHIQKPGHTEVTILGAESADAEVRLDAALDWESPSTGYLGSGTYSLSLRALDDETVEYRAHKVVLKSPEDGEDSDTDPTVRRTEVCAGELTLS
jgi:hypothetical protein